MSKSEISQIFKWHNFVLQWVSDVRRVLCISYWGGWTIHYKMWWGLFVLITSPTWFRQSKTRFYTDENFRSTLKTVRIRSFMLTRIMTWRFRSGLLRGIRRENSAKNLGETEGLIRVTREWFKRFVEGLTMNQGGLRFVACVQQLYAIVCNVF